MQTQQANYGFTVTPENGANVFRYEQEKYTGRSLLPFLIAVIIPAFLITAAISPRSFLIGLIIWLIICYALFSLVKWIMNSRRKAKQFSVNDKVITVDGQNYNRADVSSLFVQEGKGASLPDYHEKADYGSVNAHHATTQLVGMMGDQFRKNRSRVNCRVMFQYGNRNVTLANGITYETAELIIQKIQTP